MALICARKCGKVSAVHMSLVLNVVAGLVFLVVPYSPLYSARSLDKCLQEPLSAMGWLAVNVVTSLLALLGGSVGSMLCPAAVSATVFTGSGMVFGYGSQVLIFGREPDAVTLVGSSLMLLAVVIMTLFRVRPAEPTSPVQETPETSEVDQAPAPADADADDDESLISFAASDFVEFEGHRNAVRESLRIRRRHMEAESIGNSIVSVAKAVGDASANA